MNRRLVIGCLAMIRPPLEARAMVNWMAIVRRVPAWRQAKTDPVAVVEFSSDYNTVASAGRDHMVRVWDVSAYAARKATPAP
jgi:hypothetical protein